MPLRGRKTNFKQQNSVSSYLSRYWEFLIQNNTRRLWRRYDILNLVWIPRKVPIYPLKVPRRHDLLIDQEIKSWDILRWRCVGVEREDVNHQHDEQFFIKKEASSFPDLVTTRMRNVLGHSRIQINIAHAILFIVDLLKQSSSEITNSPSFIHKFKPRWNFAMILWPIVQTGF